MKLKGSSLRFDSKLSTPGYWWKAESPQNKIPGILTIGPGEDIKLKLLGAFSDSPFNPQDEKLEIVHGVVEGGEEVTLYHLSRSNSTFGTGFPSEIYYSLNLFTGGHLTKDNLQFSKISIQVSNLEEWLDSRLIDKTSVWNDKAVSEINVTYRRPEDTEFKIPSKNATLTIRHGFNSTMPRSKGYSIDLSVNSIFTFNTPQPLSNIHEIIYQIDCLYSFLVGEPIVIYQIRYAIDEQWGTWLYKVSHHREAKSIHPGRYILNHGSIKNNFEDLLEMWFSKFKDLEPVFNLFFASFTRSDFYVQTHFINLIQSLEVLHRRAFPTSKTDKEKFKNIIDDISKSLPQDLDPKIRNKILSSVGHAYEPGLSERISQLIALVPDELISKFVGDEKTFAAEVVKTRNYLTHYSNSGHLNDRPMKMALRSEQMLFLCACLLLREISIPFDQAKSNLMNRFDYLYRWKIKYEHC